MENHLITSKIASIREKKSQRKQKKKSLASTSEEEKQKLEKSALRLTVKW